MKKYMFTILLVLSVGIALPQMWKKVIEANGGELIARIEAFFPGIDAKQETLPGTDENMPATDETVATPTEGTVPGTDEVPAIPTEETQPTEAETVPDENVSGGDGADTEEVPKVPTGELPSETGESSPMEETTDEEDAEKSFVTVDSSYWDDALFIGDSRTVGLSEYADLGGADVFANSGMSVYRVFSEKISMPQGGKQTLEEVLAAKQYGKIYIMMGINELGYNHESTVKKYQEMVEKIHELQPDAILFLGANLHVTEKKSASDKIFNNEAINRINQAVEEMADNKTIFYVDVNEVFDDANGNLDADYTADESHVLGKYYAKWAEWLLTKGI